MIHDGTAFDGFFGIPKGFNHNPFIEWWLSHPSEKYESQMGVLFPICGKIKNVPNHQPALSISN
jgi:hypothetical protein